MGESVRTPPPSVGSLIGDRYRLEEPVGTGGMAQVWAATDTILNRRVAVKILHPHLRADDSFVTRFRHEARSAARLHHHAVVAVYDTVSSDEAEAIVMELVTGVTLRAHLDRVGRLSPWEVVRIGTEVAGALAAAHRDGLTHRDVKPANILLCADGSVKVADFGIAKSEADGDLTRDGTMVGTAGYLAPEQVEGGSVDGRADQFALGVVLYESLTGRLPFIGDSETARALARLHQVPPRPDEVADGIPVELAAVVMRALARDPARRFGSMPEFAAALDRSLQPGPSRAAAPSIAAVPTPAAPTPARSGGRTGELDRPVPHRERRWFGSLVLILLIAGAVLLIAALVEGGTGGRRREDAGPGLGADLVLVPIQSVTPFDPEGQGTPGENDDRAARTHDGDVTTAWRSERYRQRDFGVKSGVGLVVTLDRDARLERLEIDSATSGWVAEVHVLDGAPTGPPQGEPVAILRGTEAIARSPATTVAGLTGDGRELLVWFTDLGSGPDRYRVEVNEIRVSGQV